MQLIGTILDGVLSSFASTRKSPRSPPSLCPPPDSTLASKRSIQELPFVAPTPPPPLPLALAAGVATKKQPKTAGQIQTTTTETKRPMNSPVW